jgi:rod shape determining protein RodA
VLYREGLSGAILIGGMGGIALGVICIIMGQSTIDYPFFGEAGGEFLLYGMVIFVTGISLLSVKLFTLPRHRKKRIWATALWGLAAIIFSVGVSTVMKTDMLLKGYQKQRILITLGQVEDPQGSGYNLDKSKMAIGSGGFTGKGYLRGPMTKFNYVPEQSTDFIFSTIGEEWGFVGCFIVIILQVTLCIRLIFLAERQRSQFSRVYGYSCASILFMHLLINVGMVIGLAPVIGIPLPFFSYGGSSIMGFTILICIMLRLDAERLTIFR